MKTSNNINPDDYADYSLWNHFFDEHVVFYNNVTIEQMIKDLQTEITDRKTEKTK